MSISSPNFHAQSFNSSPETLGLDFYTDSKNQIVIGIFLLTISTYYLFKCLPRGRCYRQINQNNRRGYCIPFLVTHIPGVLLTAIGTARKFIEYKQTLDDSFPSNNI